MSILSNLPIGQAIEVDRLKEAIPFAAALATRLMRLIGLSTGKVSDGQRRA